MKILAILVIALGSFDLKAETPRITRLKSNTNAVIKPQAQRRNQDAALIRQMLESNKKLMALLERRTGVPVIWEQGAKILTGKVVRGTLLNSIVSTNLSSPILVLAHPGQGLPPKTKFSCSGMTQNKRVLTLCSKMVTQDKEIPIVAQILNLDGTSGLLGEYDDGKEELIMGAIASDFAQGMLSAAQTKLASPFGAIREDSLKNQLMQGGIQSGRTTSDILLEEAKTTEPIVTVNAGEEVLVYFMEAVNEN